MKLEKIKTHVDGLFGNNFWGELKVLGLALGHKLPKKDLKALAEFRSMLARSMPPPERYIRNSPSENGFIRGYLEALQDVAAAFAAEVQPEVDNKEAVGLLTEFGYNPLVLALLQEGHSTAKNLSEYLLTEARCALPEEEEEALKNYGLEAVENNLKVLCNAGLAECFGQSPLVYRLTLRGETVANMLKSEEK